MNNDTKRTSCRLYYCLFCVALVSISQLMKRTFLTLILFCTGTIFCLAQITFEKTYPIPIASKGNSVKQTLDGGYIVGGTYITKTTDSGAVEWIYPKDADYVNLTSDSGYISLSNNGNILFRKFDKLGDTVWTRSYTDGVWGREAYSMEQTSDGGYIVAGRFQSVTGSGMMLLKLNSMGGTQWRRTYSTATSAAFCYGRSVHQTNDGGYIIAGYTEVDYYDPNRHTDVFIVKTDSIGTAQWTKTYGYTKNDYAYEIHPTNNGYILAGSLFDSTRGGNDRYLLKLDMLGDTLWTRTYGGSFDSELKSVWPTSDGSYIVAGSSNINSGGGPSNVVVLKIDSNGNQLWSKEFGGTDADAANAIQQTNDGGYVFTGFKNANTISNGVMYLVKMDSTGTVSAPLNIAELQNEHSRIKIYPNPTSGSIFIKSDLSDLQFEIYSLRGQRVFYKSLEKGESNFNVESISKGFYLYQVANKEAVLQSGKLVFER